MKKILVTLFIFASFTAYSQEDAWVYFNDKPDSQTYLDNPLTMLTQRALDRRTNQNIVLNVNDVPVHQPYINQITASTGITVLAKSKWLNCLHIRGEIADINALTSLAFVNHVQFADNSLNARLALQPKKQNKPVNKQLSVLTNFNYGNSLNQIQMLNGVTVHQSGFTGQGKIIAVLDAGFINVNVVSPFQRLFDNNLILGGYNYVNQNSNVYDSDTHGTLVLSCMGGFVDNILVGTAPDAQYYLFVTEDVNSENPVEESYWVQAAEEADRLGVDVITTSLGYYEFDNPNYGHIYDDFTGDNAFASKGANIAFSKGIVVLASAGNEGQKLEPLNHVGVPAEATNVLAVGAVKGNETLALFSSVGPSFDGRIKPDIMAKGQSSTVANEAGNVQNANGTSFSCPIMAGMLTSFWSGVPNLTAQQVVNYVKQSADRFTTPDNQFGYGIPDFGLALSNAQLLSVNSNSNQTFLVYPNPANDKINISFPSSFDAATISIYNALGQQIVSKQIAQPTSTISVSTLNAGVYFYKIQNNSFTQSGKIIKN
jgi:serine protease AprX